MSILICDICGTSYSGTDEKCPTCGYSRAFEAAEPETERPHTVHEKVRGGRFSKKNVRKRMLLREQNGPETADHGEPESGDGVFTPEQKESQDTAPVIVPDIPAAEPEPEKKQKALAVYRRDVLRNLAIFFFGALLVVSAVYLTIHYGLPWLDSVTRPGQSVTETDPPTAPPTDPPTDSPTDPPTEPPTDPPTQPTTEESTEPLPDISLTLNYYDLTFGAATQVTQLQADGIPPEDITWISDDPGVATVSDTGLITAVGSGRTTVRAIYGDQEVTVKINCRF